MVPAKTYELRILFSGSADANSGIKDLVMAWLSGNGIESFVEGVVDSLDLDPDYDNTGRDFYEEQGGRLSPLSIFDYDEKMLTTLSENLLKEFGSKVKIEHSSQETSTWMEGWKDSFKPLRTNRFCIYPPWEKPVGIGDLIAVEIEPGMAFGTGQHQTTQLCLNQIERVSQNLENFESKRFLDVGTGSGILAIAARKLGFEKVYATDIEAPAVHAAQENAKSNNVDIKVWKGSVPMPADDRDEFHTPFDVVIANILIVVLERIIFDLGEITESGGRLILSGLLKEQKDHMLEMADEVGFGLVEAHSLNDWACLELEKL